MQTQTSVKKPIGKFIEGKTVITNVKDSKGKVVGSYRTDSEERM